MNQGLNRSHKSGNSKRSKCKRIIYWDKHFHTPYMIITIAVLTFRGFIKQESQYKNTKYIVSHYECCKLNQLTLK